MKQPGLSRDEWLERLTRIDRSLRQQGMTAQLTLVDSAAGILAGQPGRTSIDLDVWKPKSRYQFPVLKKAVEDAGLLFDPKSTLEPETPYIQLVEPGITPLDAAIMEHEVKLWNWVRAETVDSRVFQIP